MQSIKGAVLALAAFACLSGANIAQAQQAAPVQPLCPQFPPTKVMFSVSSVPLKIERMTPQQMDATIEGREYNPDADDTNFSTGLYNSGVSWKYDNDYDIRHIGNQACIAFKAVKIIVTHAPEVKIASDHLPGTCAGQRSEKWANGFVALDKEMLGELQKKMSAAILAQDFIKTPTGPISNSTINDVLKGLIARQEVAYDRVVKNWTKEEQRRARVYKTQWHETRPAC